MVVVAVVVVAAVVVEVRVLKLVKLVRLVKLIGVYFFDILTSKKAQNPQFLHFWLRNVLRATTACTFSTSQLPKVVRACGVFYILTSKCASRHNGVHFFDISTSKSGPRPPVFNTFDFEMCFAPQRRALFRHLNFQKWSDNGVFCTFWLQRRALFRHLNFQKWSDNGVFCTFWLGNLLRATTARNFSSLIWPAGSAPAALASLLFDPPEPQIIGKTQCFATFLPFRASASSFFWLFLFWSSLFWSFLFWLFPCFSTVHIVGSFTSKLPSINLTSSVLYQLQGNPLFAIPLITSFASAPCRPKPMMPGRPWMPLPEVTTSFTSSRKWSHWPCKFNQHCLWWYYVGYPWLSMVIHYQLGIHHKQCDMLLPCHLLGLKKM